MQHTVTNLGLTECPWVLGVTV